MKFPPPIHCLYKLQKKLLFLLQLDFYYIIITIDNESFHRLLQALFNKLKVKCIIIYQVFKKLY